MVTARKMDDFDESQSIQILEPDIDQQYVPERRAGSERRGAAPSRSPAATASAVRQKAPVLIVERQVVQQPAPPPPSLSSPQQLQQPKAAVVQQEPTQLSLASRIIDVANAEAIVTHAQSDGSKNVWRQRVSDAVSILVQFFTMAIVVFVALVLINPPFVQEAAVNSLGVRQRLNDPVRRPASLKRAAIWAAVAGTAFLVLPHIWNICSSRFFPDDLLMAAGLREPRRSVSSRSKK